MHTSRSMDDTLWSQGLTGRFPSKDQPQNQSNIRRNSAAHVERILQVLGVLGKSSMLGKRMLNAILRMRSTDRQGHPAWKRSHDLAAFETEELFPSLFLHSSFDTLIHGGSNSYFPASATPTCVGHCAIGSDAMKLSQL